MKHTTSRPARPLLRSIPLASLIALAFGMAAKAETPPPNSAEQLAQRDIAGTFIAEALKNNPSLDAAERRYDAARASIDSAAVLPNPTAQITHFVESIQTRTGPQRQAIMLQQPIPWLGKLNRRRDAARSQSEALWHAYAQAQLELASGIAQQVLEVAFLDKSITIQQQNLELLRQLEPVVGDRVRAGGNLTDLLRLQTEIGRMEDKLARQTTLRKASGFQLEAALGRAPGDGVDAFDWSVPEPLNAPRQLWIDAVLERSPQLAMLRAVANSQEARVRLARLASRPDFSVGVNYIRTGEARDPSMQGSGDDPWAIMVGVSLPIWGKANSAVARQASFEQDAIAAQISEAELALLATCKASIARLEDAQSRMQRFDTQLLPLARQAREILASSYRSGNASILDVIDHERTLLQLETEYWRAAADAWQSRWKLATLSGGLWLE